MTAPSSCLRFAALGDSVTYGLGDRTSNRSRGWARLLGEAIARDHRVSFCSLAHPGATTADLRTKQLSQALDHRPHVASLIIGLNDTMGSTWDPAAVRADLLYAAGRLTEQGALLLTVRFHDHSRVFGLPGFLARPMRRRIDDLNAIYDEIHTRYGGVQVDLANHPGVYDREFWSIDRLHPSELGHRALAHEFSVLLDQHGLTFDPPALELDGDPTTRLSELRTLAVDGVPWVARRVRDLGRRALQTALHGSQASPVQGTTSSPPDETMTMPETRSDPHALATALRRELLRLAAREEHLAAAEAGLVPYWAPHPPSVHGQRTAATALHSRADQLLTANSGALTAGEMTT